VRNWVNVILIVALGLLLSAVLRSIGRSLNHGKLTVGWARFINIFWLVYLAAAYFVANRYLGY
jgi:hypothetical protein